MPRPTRRSVLSGLATLAAGPVLAQPQPAAPPPAGGPPAPNPFRTEDVVRRAREMAGAPFDAGVPPLPEPFNRLDFDAYRDIRFRPDRAFLGSAGGPFRMQLFHLGFLYQRPVVINVLRDGVPTPIPYQRELFDFGRTRVERPLPISLGFAGFRLHHPLNSPRVSDELIAFLGASYFRFLGREQRYGLSARGLAVSVQGGAPEEFPFFREFWVEIPSAGAERAVIHALLDGPSVTGAYRFEVYPSPETTVEVTATLFPRRAMPAVGLAPLTSMFVTGETDRRRTDDFRPEFHDSDGLLIQTGAGEWIWRPLRNPRVKSVSTFMDTNPRGFGLMQRDRIFENYQDLEAAYHLRPGYWVEPVGSWGEGRVELVEIPTPNETNDNIVAYWQPRAPYEPGQEVTLAYRLRAIGATDAMHSGAKAVNTFSAPARASGSADPADPGIRRFIVDFAGGDLEYYLSDPGQVQLVPSTSAGQITHTFLVPNEHTKGFRAAIDVKLEPGQIADLRAFLKAGPKALTETWTYPWMAE
ncbi:MAG TPA: glucan biosynthesis protein G [Beijerinckiaceae bacterium]|jgi:glucans biosynthesis protein